MSFLQECLWRNFLEGFFGRIFFEKFLGGFFGGIFFWGVGIICLHCQSYLNMKGIDLFVKILVFVKILSLKNALKKGICPNTSFEIDTFCLSKLFAYKTSQEEFSHQIQTKIFRIEREY